MRLDQKSLNAILDKGHLRVSDTFGGKIPGKVRISVDGAIESDVEQVIESIDTSQIETLYNPGQLFGAVFRGASLLSLNKLLRLDHRTGELKHYRAACHEAAERSVIQALGQAKHLRAPLPKGLSVSLMRTGAKPFDNDALVASYKFLIDGFRHAWLLQEDDPSHIVAFDKLVQHCGAGQLPSIGITFHLGR